jgi:mercuric ion transport protein
MTASLLNRIPDKATGLLAASGLLGGLAASSCCLLPLALVGLGLGGAWIGNLTALEPYGPAFILFALASLGLGFRRLRRASSAACETGAVCADPMPRRIVRAALWGGVVLVCVAAAFPYAVPIILR